MYPQYDQRQTGGDIAIWLLLTVGALLVPTVVIAICCIRRHLARSPTIKPIEKRSPNKIMDVKSTMGLRSYNGPYIESTIDQKKLSSASTTPQTGSRTNSLKRSHVHWPDGSNISRGDDLRSIKDRQFTPRKQPLTGGDLLHTTTLTESPSSHRRVALIPTPSSALSHLIQTAIIPAGSTVTNPGASQLLISSKQPTANGNVPNSAV